MVDQNKRTFESVEAQMWRRQSVFVLMKCFWFINKYYFFQEMDINSANCLGLKCHFMSWLLSENVFVEAYFRIVVNLIDKLKSFFVSKQIFDVFYELMRYIRCNFQWKTLNSKVLLRSGSKICLPRKLWIVYKSIKPINGYERKCDEKRISEMTLRICSYMLWVLCAPL